MNKTREALQTKRFNALQTAALLKEKDDILILCHRRPDGDTLGSGFGLLRALQDLGKQARIECADEFPSRFQFLWEGLDIHNQPQFEPRFVVAVDVASTGLLGDALEEKWKDKIDLSIDHHGSNSGFAQAAFVEPQAAAACQIMYQVIAGLVPLTRQIALCLYTGLATDTGCFRYSNTTADTLYTAAELVKTGIDSAGVNKKLFETKSKGRIQLEQRALSRLEYGFGGCMAMITVLQKDMAEAAVTEMETDGLSEMVRQIEGVEIAILIREQAPEEYRVSVRTGNKANASQICARFGGGGHARAAGCTLYQPLEQAKAALKAVCGAVLENREG